MQMEKLSVPDCTEYEPVLPAESPPLPVFPHEKMLGHTFEFTAKAGDSITYGAHMEGQGSSRGETYPARLRELLEGAPDAKK